MPVQGIGIASHLTLLIPLRFDPPALIDRQLTTAGYTREHFLPTKDTKKIATGSYRKDKELVTFSMHSDKTASLAYLNSIR